MRVGYVVGASMALRATTEPSFVNTGSCDPDIPRRRYSSSSGAMNDVTSSDRPLHEVLVRSQDSIACYFSSDRTHGRSQCEKPANSSTPP